MPNRQTNIWDTVARALEEIDRAHAACLKSDAPQRTSAEVVRRSDQAVDRSVDAINWSRGDEAA
jgi:hypothetical protein